MHEIQLFSDDDYVGNLQKEGEEEEEINQLNDVCLFHQICHIIFKLPRETVHIGFSTSAILDFQLSHTVVRWRSSPFPYNWKDIENRLWKCQDHDFISCSFLVLARS